MNDNTTNNIVSIGGKVLSEEQAQEIAAKRVAPARLQPAPPAVSKDDETLQIQLKALDDIRALLASGQLEGFVLVGRSPRGVFLTEVAVAGTGPVEHVLSYIGAIECVKLELTDIGQNLPQMINDGSIVATQQIADLVE